jgi:hypothetical protein
MIQHLKHKEIDKSKWDKCISESQLALPYALSWYLDVVSPNWHALVFNDYEFVFPLPIKSKFGLSYFVQPVFTQQLGIFGKENLTPIVVNWFLKNIPRKLKSVINLNELMCDFVPKRFKLRPNYVLDTSKKEFSSSTKRNIKKAVLNQIEITTNLPIEVVSAFIINENPHFSPNELSLFKKLLAEGLKNKVFEVYAAVKGEQLVACAILSKLSKRAIYLFNASSKDGKEIGAMHLLIDTFIKENIEIQELDFEGSSVPGVARFYKGFGADEKRYPILNKGFFK